jgi:hypothetical protein
LGLTLESALQTAKQEAEQRKAAGWDQAALDKAAATGLANGAFEDSEEEGDAVVEEFFNATPSTPARPTATLAEKLQAKAVQKVTP